MSLARLAALDTATIHEAQGRRGAFPSSVKPVHPSARLCGPAFTVDCPPGDNLWIHRGVYAAEPGDVLVVDVRGATEAGYWGEVLSVAALARGLVGLVITGGVRDSAALGDRGFPVFSAGLCIGGTSKDPHGDGALGVALRIGDAEVRPGDIVAGDGDGVVVVRAEELAAVADAAGARVEQEAQVMERLRAGDSTLAIFGWE
jgi:4-hydroxy-4-methyl-2-oxoglutarate aldolase